MGKRFTTRSNSGKGFLCNTSPQQVGGWGKTHFLQDETDDDPHNPFAPWVPKGSQTSPQHGTGHPFKCTRQLRNPSNFLLLFICFSLVAFLHTPCCLRTIMFMPHLPIQIARLLKAGVVFFFFFILGFPRCPGSSVTGTDTLEVSDTWQSFSSGPAFCGALCACCCGS